MILIITITFLVSALITFLLYKSANKVGLIDIPNERSLHTIPTPRTGGIAIIIAIVAGAIMAERYYPGHYVPLPIYSAFVLLSVLSLFDDYKHVSPIIRISGHFAAAAIIVLNNLYVTPDNFSLLGALFESPYVLIVFSVLFIVWLINLYNFMDGMDGLAATMSIIGFSTYAYLGLGQQQYDFMLLSAIVVCATAGFLIFNFPPARIFMGDTGSSVLGLIVAVMTLYGVNRGIFSFWTGVIVFSPFIYDATLTLFHRVYKKERIWEAHKTHLYQRLVERIGSHRPVLVLEATLMVVCSLLAVWFQNSEQFMALICITILISLYMIFTIMVFRAAPATGKS